MKTLIFRVKGEYAHFKKPYSPMSPVTYSFPPPPAVLGLLGAILGLEKDRYHKELGWQQVKIGVQLNTEVRVFRTGLNLLNTKDGTDPYFRPKAGKNIHIQVPFEFLKEPDYQIYVGNLPKSVHSKLVKLLASGKSLFTPVLGLAQCIADLIWINEAKAEPVNKEYWQVDSVLAKNETMQPFYDDGRRYHRFRIPSVMDQDRVVHQYKEVVVADDGGPIRGQGQPQGLYKVDKHYVSFL